MKHKSHRRAKQEQKQKYKLRLRRRAKHNPGSRPYRAYANALKYLLINETILVESRSDYDKICLAFQELISLTRDPPSDYKWRLGNILKDLFLISQ